MIRFKDLVSYKLQEHETDPALELKVGNYQTKHFHMCPGAKSVYEKLDDNIDMDLAERAAKLQDALFFIEEHVLQDYGDGGAPDGYALVAENLADQIMAMAKMIRLEKEHNYIQGHVDKIKGAL